MTNPTRRITHDKTLREWVELALAAGWTVQLQRAGHLRWYPPDGAPFIATSSTPSDVHAYKRIRGALRRAGLVIR